jgi:hypothetical protein
VRTEKLADESPHGLAHGGHIEVELTSLGRSEIVGFACPEIVGFQLSTEDWSAPAAGWVQSDCIDLIQSRLDAKEIEYPDYRKACDECWLLISASGFHPSSLFSPSRETLEHRYKTSFEKVFLMECFSGSLKELSRV